MALNAKTAYINLTTGSVRIEPISLEDRRRFLGGRGLNIKVLIDRNLKRQVDALSPENTIVVSTGLLAGMLAPGANRTIISTISPLTGYLAGANIRSFFSPELRQAGFDSLVITGKARKPAFIHVHDGKIKIRDASVLWGKTVQDTQEILRHQLEDDDVQTVCIGPAGERQVRFACVSTRDLAEDGQAGIGAVFGAKNLKAIVARGDRGIPIEHPADALQYNREVEHTVVSSDLGQRVIASGVASLEGRDNDLFADQTTGRDSCYACQLRCRRKYTIARGEHAGTFGSGPSCPSTHAWADVLGTDQPESILFVDHLANSYGLDPLETAGTVGWAVRLYEEGIITSADTGGIILRHGDASCVESLITMIANRQGVGDLLAEGSERAGDKIVGAAALPFSEYGWVARESASRELTPWQALGLSTASMRLDSQRFRNTCDPLHLPEPALEERLNGTGPGGDESSEMQTDTSTPWLVRWTQIHSAAADMLGLCDLQTALFDPNFPGFEEFSKMIELNIGLSLSSRDIREAADRVLIAERLFNLNRGYSPSLEKFGNWCPPGGFGRMGNTSLDEAGFDQALAGYYRLVGWDSQGVPDRETVKRLGMGNWSNVPASK